MIGTRNEDYVYDEIDYARRNENVNFYCFFLQYITAYLAHLLVRIKLGLSISSVGVQPFGPTLLGPTLLGPIHFNLAKVFHHITLLHPDTML